jgi:hypothetical protein
VTIAKPALEFLPFRLIELKQRRAGRCEFAVSRFMKRCKQLKELPTVVTEWQRTTWCPDCDYYHAGKCDDPKRATSRAPCAFDGSELSLREIAVGDEMSQRRVQSDFCLDTPGKACPLGLEEDVRQKILERTWGRIHALKVDADTNKIVISGHAPSYYVKQLAIHAALEVIGPDERRRVELHLEVEG